MIDTFEFRTYVGPFSQLEAWLNEQGQDGYRLASFQVVGTSTYAVADKINFSDVDEEPY